VGISTARRPTSVLRERELMLVLFTTTLLCAFVAARPDKAVPEGERSPGMPLIRETYRVNWL
jgi:hypothetical protein